jgi:regulator of protease activity HflC (stomatin/prohibitin superfamily)
MPGPGVQIPLVHITRVRDIREHTIDIEPQPVIIKDNVEITVDGVMWVHPTGDEESIKRTFLQYRQLETSFHPIGNDESASGVWRIVAGREPDRA